MTTIESSRARHSVCRARPRPSRCFGCLALLLLLWRAVDTAHAQAFHSPEDVLASLYEGYLWGREPTDMAPFFSEALTVFMGEARLSPVLVDAHGVHPIIVSAGADITGFAIEPAPPQAGRTERVVRFAVDGAAACLRYELVEEAQHGWQVHAVSGRMGTVTWSTQTLLAAAREARLAMQ